MNTIFERIADIITNEWSIPARNDEPSIPLVIPSFDSAEILEAINSLLSK